MFCGEIQWLVEAVEFPLGDSRLGDVFVEVETGVG